MKKQCISQLEKIFVSILSLFVLSHCQNKQQSSSLDDSFYSQGDGSLSGDLSSELGNYSGGSIGSGSGGGLTDADKQALQNMTQGMQDVNPASGGGLPQDILDQAKMLIDAENNADATDAKAQAELQQKKMLLVGKILQSCAEKIAPLAPIPGQPLMGVWSGGGACGVEFGVTSTGPQPVYRVGAAAGVSKVAKDGKDSKSKVSGGQSIQGQMVAAADGTGNVDANPYRGTLSDAPQAGSGKLVHPTFHKSKSGTSPCEVAVTLKQSTNPIPENYVEAMKRVGQCHRQALLFMSPIMDNMFKNMPPELTQLLMQRAMGVSQ